MAEHSEAGARYKIDCDEADKVCNENGYALEEETNVETSKINWGTKSTRGRLKLERA